MRTRLVLLVVAAAAAVALLGVGSAAAATTWNVYCPGDDLQNTIDNLANPGDTIVVYGTCYGNFVIDSLGFAPSPLTLQGGSAGATLNGKGDDSALKILYDNVTIRNLTITNGAASEGGGLELGTATLSMSNSIVKGNRADYGGGIFAQRSILDLTGVTVTRNTARYTGGGIDVLNNTLLSMTASTVSRNATTEPPPTMCDGGGGIRIELSDALLTSTRVTSNQSAGQGGGIAVYGAGRSLPPAPIKGAAPLVSLGSGLTLVNSNVDHNTAADDGGGIYNAPTGVLQMVAVAGASAGVSVRAAPPAFGDSPVILQGTTVSFNVAQSGDGGGIANYGECDRTASLLATGSTFQGNQARNGDGGAVYNAAGVICGAAGVALVTIAQSGVANGPNVVNQNQARRGAGIANERGDGLASLSLQSGAKVTGNKASVTGGGVWNNCGSFSSLAQVMLNTPNNIVTTCIPD